MTDTTSISTGRDEDELSSQGSLSPEDRPKQRRGEFLGGARTTPIRLVEAEPFTMEVWVEEAAAKEEEEARREREGHEDSQSPQMGSP